MNLWFIFQVLQMIAQAGLRMAVLEVGQTVHTDELGMPPAFINWQDGRQFTVTLHITRRK